MTTDPARFDRVTAHPDYAATANRRIELPYNPVAAIASSAGNGLVGVIIAMIAAGILIAIRPPIWFAIAVVLVVVLAIRASFRTSLRTLHFHNLPIDRLVGVVTQTRTHVSGGGDHPMLTTYYTTLQQRDGVRAEYQTPGALAGRLSIGDIGVAYTKGQMLVDFTRFDV